MTIKSFPTHSYYTGRIILYSKGTGASRDHQSAEKLTGSAMVQVYPRRDDALTKEEGWSDTNMSVALIPFSGFYPFKYAKFNPGGNLLGGSEITPTLNEHGTDERMDSPGSVSFEVLAMT